jgi:hypothetical protein
MESGHIPKIRLWSAIAEIFLLIAQAVSGKQWHGAYIKEILHLIPFNSAL